MTHDGTARLMDSAWMVGMTSLRASCTRRCRCSRLFPSNTGATTSTSKAEPHLVAETSVTVCEESGGRWGGVSSLRAKSP
jgi:hypothetical protein